MPNDKRPARHSTAMTPEARESELVALAMDLAERQLRDGTASAQVITHFLKLGSTREMLEQEYLANRSDMAAAKKEAIESSQRMERLYSDAMNAMKRYQGEFSDGQL